MIWKDRKQFLADLKTVYAAINKEMAYDALEEFARKWGAKYGYAIKSWKDNWEELPLVVVQIHTFYKIQLPFR